MDALPNHVVSRSGKAAAQAERHVQAKQTQLQCMRHNAAKASVGHTPPAIKPNVIAQPLHPVCEILADIVLHVVNVGSSCKLITSGPVASAFELAVIHHNCLCIPCHLAPKHIPDAILVLLLGTAVVDDNVTQHFQALALQLGHTPAMYIELWWCPLSNSCL